MPVLHKSLLLAAGTGLILLAVAASDTSSAMTSGINAGLGPDVQTAQSSVTAHIAFVKPIRASKKSDISFGEVDASPNDEVSLNPDGTMRIKGKGDVLEPYGHPSVINIGDTRNSMMNLVTTNYSLGPGIGSLHANCVIQGGGNCAQNPIFGKQQTLFIGMDLTVGSQPEAPLPDTASLPSFDMSIVYQ